MDRESSMVWTYTTRILAAALFAVAMFVLGKLIHALIDISILAGAALISATLVIGVLIENSDRRRDGRPRYSMREGLDDLLVPLGLFAALLLGCWIIDYRERPTLVGAWIFGIMAIWIARTVIEMRKERRADAAAQAARLPRAPTPSMSAAGCPSSPDCARSCSYPFESASDHSS
jgi:hypothetical protein